MERLALKAKIRMEKGKKVKELRQKRQIPAVLYGHGLKNQNLAMDYLDFEKIYQLSGGKGLVDLEIEGQPAVKVLIQDFQLDALTNLFSHVDLRQVRMEEKIKTDVNLRFSGEAPAVKELGGIFVKSFSAVPVECLPQDLVPEINVEISSLKEFGNVIHIGDIIAPSGIKILAHAEDVIATVTAPAKEEAPPTPAAVDLSQIKTEAEEKREKKAAETGEEEATPEKKSAEKKEEKKK